ILLEAVSLLIIPPDVQLHFWQSASHWTARVQPFPDNHAITGPLLRLLSMNYYTHGIGNYEAIAQLLGWIISSAMLLTFITRVRRMPEQDFGLGFSYAIVTSLIISPLTDTHHFVLLLIPFLFWGFSQQSRPGWIWFFAFFAVYSPLMMFGGGPVRRMF